MNAPARLPNDTRLDRLAEVAVKVGLGLKAGQELVMTAPIQAAPLARKITEEAYKAGATLVTTIYADDEATLARFAHAPDEAFDVARPGSTRAWPRPTTPAPPASRSPVPTRICWPARIPRRWRAPIARRRRPTSRRCNRS